MDTGVVDDEGVTAVSRLWQAHLQASIPATLRGVEIAGVDMVMLDADTAGCVHTWLHHAGLSASRARTRLTICLNDLNRVLPLLTNPPEADYYRRLRDLADLICDLPDWDPSPRA